MVARRRQRDCQEPRPPVSCRLEARLPEARRMGETHRGPAWLRAHLSAALEGPARVSTSMPWISGTPNERNLHASPNEKSRLCARVLPSGWPGLSCLRRRADPDADARRDPIGSATAEPAAARRPFGLSPGNPSMQSIWQTSKGAMTGPRSRPRRTVTNAAVGATVVPMPRPVTTAAPWSLISWPAGSDSDAAQVLSSLSTRQAPTMGTFRASARSSSGQRPTARPLNVGN